MNGSLRQSHLSPDLKKEMVPPAKRAEEMREGNSCPMHRGLKAYLCL